MNTDFTAWPGFSSNCTLIFDVDRKLFDIDSDAVEYRRITYQSKPETHITVIGSSLGNQLCNKATRDKTIENQLTAAFEHTNWAFDKTTPLRRLVRESCDEKGNTMLEESIIMLISLPGMTDFYSELKSLMLIAPGHPVPPPHVTLYTRNCDKGISIHDEAELAALTRELVNPEDLVKI